jgi:methyl-accepting chemotaxis protein
MWSAFALYTLPQELIHSQAIHVLNSTAARLVFLKPAVIVVVTFALGVFALNVSFRSKREVIVFVDKVKTTDDTQAKNAARESETGDLGSLRLALQQAQGTQAVLQAGVNNICNQIEAGIGALYAAKKEGDKRTLTLACGFALSLGESQTLRFEFGEGLIGQAAATGKSLYIDEVPEGYIKVVSGLGTASPRYLFIMALKKEDEVKGVFEVATFSPLSEATRKRLEEMGAILVEKLS